MSEVAHEAQPEFWRPPAPMPADDVMVREAISSMAEICPRCGTEYLMGSRFCHTCGGRRPAALSAEARADAAEMAGLWQRTVGRVHAAAVGIPWSRMWNWIKVPSWFRFPGWLQYLHFHEIQNRVGLSTASLIGFVIGLGCVAGALLVGLLNVRTFVDWQAIQFYRAEWLLAATAAFVAGILLKKPS